MSDLTVQHVADALGRIAPLRYAEDWDNVGLLIGSPTWSASRVMMTIDLTEDVLDEAIEAGADMVVSYHPPIFEPLRRLTDSAEKSRIALRAARANLAVYSPHTALDATPGGVNDWLVGGFGSGDVRALHAFEELPPSEQCKVITYGPRDAIEHVRASLGTVGAGNIGDYHLCSFEISGTGTFLGGAGTNPTVGEAGQLERVPEVRLEMVIKRDALALAVRTIRQVHPYEEPPIEILRMEPRPIRHIGGGRRITLDQPSTLEDLVARIKEVLGVPYVRVSRGRDAPDAYRVIGACAGAGGSMVDEAIDQGCELYLTGEMRHHDVLAATARGCTLILPGHTNTERGYLPELRRRLADEIDGALDGDAIRISVRDRSSFEVV